MLWQRLCFAAATPTAAGDTTREKSSRLEPTAWATLALGEGADAAKASAVLRKWPSKDGLLLERAGGEPNYAFHGLALLVMRARRIEHSAGNAVLLGGLQRVKGMALAPSTHQPAGQRPSRMVLDCRYFQLGGTDGLVPVVVEEMGAETGARVDSQRIDEAERLLIDRSCLGGGWNYGNSNMLGQELEPYVPTTAVALLAMQDRRTHPVVDRSLNYLEKHATSERSGHRVGPRPARSPGLRTTRRRGSGRAERAIVNYAGAPQIMRRLRCPFAH